MSTVIKGGTNVTADLTCKSAAMVLARVAPSEMCW
jgi:hypothetical protein